MLAVVVLVASIWVPRVYQRYLVIQAQRRCLSYTAPSTQIVYDEVDDKITLVSPPVWDQFQQRSRIVGFGAVTVLFMHERISTGGAQRLVCITFDRMSLGRESVETEELSAISIEVESLWKDANTHIFILHGGDVGWQSPPAGTLRFYAGQADPSDQSHFTIVFESQGKKGMLDGWLLDDPSAIQGVRIKLAARAAPATGKTQ